MLRPCFLVVDREFSSGISTRKLVIETAKFNVITAYNASEAIETLAAFPAVHAAVIDEHLEDGSSTELVSDLKRVKPDLIVIAIGSQNRCRNADYHVESFSPEKLLGLLRKLRPTETAEIEKTNRELESTESEH